MHPAARYTAGMEQPADPAPRDAAPNSPTMAGADRLLLSAREAADRLGISRSSLYLLLADGSVDSVRVGARRLVPVEALTDFVRQLRSNPSHPVRPGDPSRRSA